MHTLPSTLAQYFELPVGAHQPGDAFAAQVSRCLRCEAYDVSPTRPGTYACSAHGARHMIWLGNIYQREGGQYRSINPLLKLIP